ncbi:DUF4920 domain-containing protein [Flavobacterium sp.]|uniref:DUF4920 domain-containing protein n=1 Tax=Flavobacterium sp. TaxID=239 RepID=UPI0037527686
MKKNTLIIVMILLFGYNSNAQEILKKSKTVAINTDDYASFGNKFAVKNVLNENQMLKKYKSLKNGDSIKVQFKSKIKEVCKKKGCWMQMNLSDDKQSFVKFKDYSFFVPLNADNSDAIINGIAFVNIVSVSELKHYAKDGGKTQEEINKIKKPKTTYSFMADGVLIKK